MNDEWEVEVHSMVSGAAGTLTFNTDPGYTVGQYVNVTLQIGRAGQLVTHPVSGVVTYAGPRRRPPDPPPREWFGDVWVCKRGDWVQVNGGDDDGTAELSFAEARALGEYLIELADEGEKSATGT